MTNTDMIIAVFLLIQAANGAHHGFLSSVARPLALALAIGGAWLYYTLTHQLLVSCLIGSFGSFLLSWLIGMILHWQTATEGPPQLSLISRLSGLAINLTWSTALACVTVVILLMVPFDKMGLSNVSNDVQKSMTLQLLNPILIQAGILAEEEPSESESESEPEPELTSAPSTSVPSTSRPSTSQPLTSQPSTSSTPKRSTSTPCMGSVCGMSDSAADALARDSDIKEITDDPIMKKLMKDKEALAAMESRDIKRILSNPTITEMRENPAFIMKVLKAYPKIQQKLNASKLPAHPKTQE